MLKCYRTLTRSFQISLFSGVLKEMIFLPCSSRQDDSSGHPVPAPVTSMSIWTEGLSMPLYVWKQGHTCKLYEESAWHWYSSVISLDGTYQLCRDFSSTAFPLFQPFILLTWTGFGKTNGMRASMVTTQGEMVVPKLLPRNGPRGTYSHFWMSRAGRRKFKAMLLNIS